MGLRFKESHVLEVDDRIDVYGTQQFSFSSSLFSLFISLSLSLIQILLSSVDEYNENVDKIDDCQGSRLKGSKPLFSIIGSLDGKWSQSGVCSLQTCDIDESSCVANVESQKVCGENLQKLFPGDHLNCTTDSLFFALDNRIFFSGDCKELNLNRTGAQIYNVFEKGSSASSLGISFLLLISVIVFAHLGL